MVVGSIVFEFDVNALIDTDFHLQGLIVGIWDYFVFIMIYQKFLFFDKFSFF